MLYGADELDEMYRSGLATTTAQPTNTLSTTQPQPAAVQQEQENSNLIDLDTLTQAFVASTPSYGEQVAATMRTAGRSAVAGVAASSLPRTLKHPIEAWMKLNAGDSAAQVFPSSESIREGGFQDYEEADARLAAEYETDPEKYAKHLTWLDADKNGSKALPFFDYKRQAREKSQELLEEGEQLPVDSNKWPVTPRNAWLASPDTTEALKAAEEREAERIERTKWAAAFQAGSPEDVKWAANYAQETKHNPVSQAVLDFSANWPNMTAAIAGAAANRAVPGAGGVAAFGFMSAQEEAGFITAAQEVGIPMDFAAKYAQEYGVASGAIEYAEQLVNIAGLTGGAGKKAAAGLLKKAGQGAVAVLKNAGMEGFEEVSQGALQFAQLSRMIQDYAHEKKIPVQDLVPEEMPLKEDGSVDWARATKDMGRMFQAGAGVSVVSSALGLGGSGLRAGTRRIAGSTNSDTRNAKDAAPFPAANPAPQQVEVAQPAAQPQAPAQPDPTADARLAKQLLEQQAQAATTIQTPQNAIEGADTVVHGTRGMEIPAKYVAMPRDNMQGSHSGDTMAPNPQYPLQNTRDYGGTAEREKALAVRNGFDPRRHVTDATDAAVGPVMVADVTDEQGNTSTVRLGGNTRGWAIENMPDAKRSALRELTNERADRFGIQEELPSDNYELVRHLGTFDMRQPGQREKLQQIVDGLNPAPGKVQNAGEMANVDAVNNLPTEAFAGIDMNVQPADAQVWISQQVAAGNLDANLRGQLAEKPAAAQDYVRRVVATRAFGPVQAPVVEFLQTQDSSSRVLRGMLEQAAPVLVNMRANGMGPIADAIGRAAGTIVADFESRGNAVDALDLASRQQELDPTLAVVNAVAGALRNSVETTTGQRIQAEKTLEKTADLWARIDAAVGHYSTEPDLFGETRQPHEVLAEALNRATANTAQAPAPTAGPAEAAAASDGSSAMRTPQPAAASPMRVPLADQAEAQAEFPATDGLQLEENGPFPIVGTADDNAPMAIKVRTNAATPSEWQQMKLGGLEHVKPIEMPEMLRIARKLGAVLRIRKFGGGKRGHFMAGGGSTSEIAIDMRIFANPMQAARTLAHEIGHLTDYLSDRTLKRGNLLGRLASLRGFIQGKFGEYGVTDKQIREELWTLSKWWRPFDETSASDNFLKYRKSGKELYADALSVMLNAPAELKSRAPKFWHEWIKYFERKPEVARAYIETWELLNRPEVEKLRLRQQDIKAAFADGEETMLRKAAEREQKNKSWHRWFDDMKTQNFDVYQLQKNAANRLEQQGGTVNPAADPRILFDAFPLADNPVDRAMRKMDSEVVTPLEERGLGLDQLGEWLTMNRIAHEDYLGLSGELEGRANIANPGGHSKRTASRQLAYMKATMGSADYHFLVARARDFQKIAFSAVTEAVKAGTINAELYERVLKPNWKNYATFFTVEHLKNDDSMAAGIRKQAGTLDDITNPFHSTLLKTVLIINWSQFNLAKAGAMKVLADLNEATPAKLSGGRVKNPAKAPQGKANMMVMVDGKPQWWVVDKAVKTSMAGVSPAHAIAGIRILNYGFREFVYPLLITYSTIFGARNPIKDFRRSARNLPREVGVFPGKATLKLAKNYIATWHDAVERARGNVTPRVAAMMDAAAIGTPSEMFVKGAGQPRTDAYGHLMQRAGIFPDDNKDWIYKALPFARPFLRGLSTTMAIFETLPKTAAYKLMVEDMGMDVTKSAATVRTHIGTPNFQQRGQHAALIGSIRPFINISLQGLISDMSNMFDFRKGGAARKNKGAALIRWSLGSASLVLLKAAMKRGAMGDDEKDKIEGHTDYFLTNYHVMPLGRMIGKEFGRKTLSFYWPMDESERVLNGVLYKTLTNDDGFWSGLTQILNIGAGSFPGWNVNANLVSKWTDFVTGNNPRDEFYGSEILPRDVYLRGGPEAAKYMLAWSVKKTGLTNIIRYDKDAETWQEAAIYSTPIINALFKVSDGGYREQQYDKRRIDEKINAILRGELPKEVLEAREQYYRLQRVGAANRTSYQDQEYRRLSRWYRTRYMPAFDRAQELDADGNSSEAKSVVRRIGEP